jgi:carbohydrate-selective porin OprB
MVVVASQARGEDKDVENSTLEILGPELNDFGWTPGMSPTAPEAEMEEVTTLRPGYFEVPGLSAGIDYLSGHLAELNKSTGLRIGTAYTMLFQGLSGGPWDQYGGAGDFDLMMAWTLVGRGTENSGRLVFDGENRFEIGDRTPNSLGSQVATLQPTANTFNDRGWVIRDVNWVQRLYDGQVRFLVGRADSTDYFGSTWMQSANNSFVNRMFSANPTIVAPGHGPAAGVSYRPKDNDFYISTGAANAYGTTTTSGISSLFDEWTFFSFGEVGWTPTFEKLGQGRYTVSGWHMGEREESGVPADWGVSIVADQQLNETVQVFARWGYADGAVSNIKNYIQAGTGFRGLGHPNDMAGVAFSYAFPTSDTAREEKVLEAFYRMQLTRYSQFSVGAQAIFDPANGPDHDVVGAFSARLRVFF